MIHQSRRLNIVASKDPSQDSKISAARTMSGLKTPTTFPVEVDLRRDFWGITDQSNTGANAGFAIGDGVLRFLYNRAKKIKTSETISPRLMWMMAKEADPYIKYPATILEDEGTSLKAALEICEIYGGFPIEAKNVVSTELLAHDATIYAVGSKYRIKDYFNLGEEGDLITNLKEWLVNHGPIASVLKPNQAFFDLTKGVLDSTDGETFGLHAVSIVGYSAKPSTPLNFLIRNSFGTSWGDKGFGRVSETYLLEQFQEHYGILV